MSDVIMEDDDNESNELKMYNMAKRGGLEYVDRALANKADPNWQNPDEYQKTALHQASTYNNPEIVRTLVAAGADINLQDKYGNTPLFHAACSVWGTHQGCLEAITTLIELGADIEIADVRGTTPVMVVKHIGTLEALIDAHANLRQINDSGQTTLHLIADDDLFGTKLEDKLKMVQLLLQKGLDPRRQDKKGMTPAHYAKKCEYHEMVTMMVGEDGDITELDLFNAAERGDVEYVDKALFNKINPNWVNLDESQSQRSALHQASRYNNPEIVRSLVAAGANMNEKDQHGMTPIYLASEFDSFDALTTLIDLGADVEISSDEGLTPIMVAKHISTLEALIDVVTNPRQTDCHGKTTLHWAAKQGNSSEIVQFLLQKGLDPWEKDHSSMTPVDYAKKHGYDELVTIMGGDIEITNLDLFNAAYRGDLEYVDKALANKADPNWQNPDMYQRTALHEASKSNDSEVMRSLLAAGANKDLQDEDGETPIYLASNFGEIDALNMLIDCGADINIATNSGVSPVMIAWAKEIVELLIDAHANLKQIDNSGKTALHWAADHDYSEKVPLLLQKGLDPRKQDNDGLTPVDYAKQHGYHELVTIMVGDDFKINELDFFNAAERGDVDYVNKGLANKTDPNWQNPENYQRTALHQASMNNNPEIVRSLVAAGGTINVQDKYGITPLYLASITVSSSLQGSLEVLTTLIELGADVEIASNEGVTPVMVAKHIIILEALIDAHANLRQIDYSGKTALHWAAECDYKEIVQLLLQKGLDPRKQDNKGMTPVDYAKQLGYHEMVTIIVGDDFEITELDLFNAAKRGDVKYVDRCLVNKTDPNWQNPDVYQRTALHQASEYNNPAIVRSLVSAGANINLQDRHGNTPIFLASRSVYDCLDALTTLIDLGADIEIASDGTTPLMVACKLSIVKALIGAHANLKQIDNSGKTALHWAADDDYSEIVQLLLQKGLDPRKQDNEGMTPVDYAKKHGYHELVTIMVGDDVEITNLDLFNAADRGDVEYVNKALANKTDPNWLNPDMYQRAAIHQASLYNHSATIRLLLEAGANKDLQDEDGETAIYLASNSGQIDAVTTLLACGVDIEIANPGGKTPVMTAWKVEVMEALLGAHANLKETDELGRTALHYMAWLEREGEAQLLLQKGIDTMKQDNEGLTAADYARKFGNPQLADIIENFTASTGQPSTTVPSIVAISTVPTGQPITTASTSPSTTATSTVPTGQPSSTASTTPSTTTTSTVPTGQTITTASTTPSTTATSTFPTGQPITTASTTPSTIATSNDPTDQPITTASTTPSTTATSTVPTGQPIVTASTTPSTTATSTVPTSQPITTASTTPSTTAASTVPTGQPITTASTTPSTTATSNVPTGQEITTASTTPSTTATSTVPTGQSIATASTTPSTTATSTSPTGQPITTASTNPSTTATSTVPTGQPITTASTTPSTTATSTVPTGQPIATASTTPSTTATSTVPTGQPITTASTTPSTITTSTVPTGQPITTTSTTPSTTPTSTVPTGQPSTTAFTTPSTTATSTAPTSQPTTETAAIPDYNMLLYLLSCGIVLCIAMILYLMLD